VVIFREENRNQVTSCGDHKPEEWEEMNWLREMTGIYGLGFRKESVLGLMLPFAIVTFVAIVAVVAFWVLRV
jgi:hypothetical protein